MVSSLTLFILSCIGIIGMLMWRYFELHSGTMLLESFRVRLDQVFHGVLAHMKYYFSFANKENFGIIFRFAGLFFIRIGSFIRREVRFVYNMIHDELKHRSVVKKPQNARVSFFLQHVSEHKNSISTPR